MQSTRPGYRRQEGKDGKAAFAFFQTQITVVVSAVLISRVSVCPLCWYWYTS